MSSSKESEEEKEEEKEEVENGDDALGKWNHENMAMRAGQLEVRAAQKEHGKL